MNSTQLTRLIVAAALGLTWLAVIWFGKADDPGMPELLGMIKLTLAGIVGHLMGDKGDTTRPVPSSVQVSQGGFARFSLIAMLFAFAAALCLLAGCTTTTASMYAGVATQAKAGIQVFDDNSLATMHDLLCAQPYSAIQRHPELQPGIVALCGPLVNTASLDPAQVTQMLSIAKQLGITAVATPAAAASGTK